MSILAGALAVALAMALAVLRSSGGDAMDTLLGVLRAFGAGGRAGGGVVPAGVRIDLMAYLFGDILAVSRGDLAVIWVGAGRWWR